MLFFLLGCTLIEALEEVEPPPADCAERQLVYEDADGDGYGKEEVVALVCDTRSGFVEQAGDCDDEDPTVWADCSGGGGVETGDTETGGETGETGETGGGETGDTDTADTDSGGEDSTVQ